MTRSRFGRRLPELLGVTLALLLHGWLAISASLHKSATVDETPHLTAGHAFWATGDYRLQPENGLLPQVFEGLPAYLAGRPLPPPDNPGWTRPNVWTLGDAYFHEIGNSPQSLLLGGRLMNVVWSLATGLLIYLWARRLFGRSGAAVALGFWTLCPTFLAHGALATSDMCMTFFMTASVAAYWNHLYTFGWRTGLVSALVLALAFVAKFSAVLLPIVFALLATVRLLDSTPMPWRGTPLRSLWSRAAALACSGFLHVVAAAFVIWAFHRFRFLPTDDTGLIQDYTRRWAEVLASLGSPVSTVLQTVRDLRLLPDAYLYGFAFVMDLSQMRGAFLNGETSLTGWPHFFPYAFLVKTPVALLVALVSAGGVAVLRWRTAAAGRWRADLKAVAPLLALFVVYGAFSIASTLNIGHRHLLPLYPGFLIATGSLGWAVRKVRGMAWLIVALAAGQLFASFSIRPHYLGFFNRIAGGPSEGYRHLVDSSLDWGQDLGALAEWLRDRKLPSDKTPVFLAYFGTASPRYYGIDARIIVPLLRREQAPVWHTLTPGVYCISATMLSQAYSDIRGSWSLAHEKSFQELRAVEPALIDYNRRDELRPELEKSVPAEKWAAMWDRYDQLRFARLCYLLRARSPEAQIGYSINIYRISEADIAAVNGSLDTWRQAIEASTRPAG